MYRILLLVILMPTYAGEPDLSQTLDQLQKVYDQVVTDQGYVHYEKLAKTPHLMEPFKAYAAHMATADVESWNRDEKIAYLSNAYNVFTVIGVMRAWPVPSVRKIRPLFGFFTKDEWKVNQQTISLNTLEKKMLRPLDPRIHFTINCASASCPKLLKQVFRPETIEQDMATASLEFVNDPTKNTFDNKKREWRLSKIFDWYKDDWGKEADVVQFIRELRPDLKTPKKVRYHEYDWAINAAN